MGDIVKGLRNIAQEGYRFAGDAADEIERLRKIITDSRADFETAFARMAQAQAEANRLRAEIVALKQQEPVAWCATDETKADFAEHAHELWAVAQLAPGEGIEDGVARIEAMLAGLEANKVGNEWHALTDRLKEAEEDILEQARLNGMGSEREAMLMAKLQTAEKKCDVMEVEIEALKQQQALKQQPVAWQAIGGSIWGHKTSADDRPLYAAPGAQPATSIPDDIAKDAQRFRKLCALLQGACDGEVFESESIDVYCKMQIGWKNERQLQAELRWKDQRGEPLGLGDALDAVSGCGLDRHCR